VTIAANVVVNNAIIVAEVIVERRCSRLQGGGWFVRHKAVDEWVVNLIVPY
jgi:hypothetical protein